MKRRIGIMLALLMIVSILALSIVGCAKQTSPPPTAGITPTPAPTVTPSPTQTPSPSPSPKPSPTATEAPFSFAGKTITVIVPYTAGGGADISARLYSRHLKRYLPGDPTIIVRNMPGGETTLGSNYVYRSKPDGLTILHAGGGVMLSDLLDKPGMTVPSLAEMTAILNQPPSSQMYFLRSGIISKPEDIMTAKGLIFGSTSGKAATMLVAIREFMGFTIEKLAMAYGSNAESFRAIISGEINFSGSSTVSYENQVRAYIENGQLQFAFQSGYIDTKGDIVRHAILPNVITADELYEEIYGRAPSGIAYQAYKAILASVSGVSHIWFLPPGMPDNIKKAYWDATEALVKDPQFLKEAAVLGAEGTWMAGQALDNWMKKEYGFTPEVRDWIRDFMARYGVEL